MNVKSSFLNGYLKEEVYVMQPPGFENTEFSNHVFKLDKTLYGLDRPQVYGCCSVDQCLIDLMDKGE